MEIVEGGFDERFIVGRGGGKCTSGGGGSPALGGGDGLAEESCGRGLEHGL